MKKFLVIGNPIEHSLSPKLHNYWIKSSGIDATYEKQKLEESEFFLRGANSYIGFKQKVLNFDRESRSKGITKFNKFTGSLRVGLNGIFSFSTKPLHYITLSSSMAFFFSLIIFLLYLILTFLKLFVFKYQFFIIVLILLVSSFPFVKRTHLLSFKSIAGNNFTLYFYKNTNL